jgi:glucosyl-3-phosphoglycerate synthase
MNERIGERLPGGAIRTFTAQDLDISRLVTQKEARAWTVSACLPALDEEATIGPICEAIVRDLIEPGLIDQLLVVVDERSSDGTAEIAARAGAEVRISSELVPQVPSGAGGKGDVLWRSLAAATGDVVAWVDADIVDFDTRLVAGLLIPFFEDPSIQYVKGFYRRDNDKGRSQPMGGGRVTELVARPLLSMFYPELARLIQPLSGEMAGLRETLLDVPFLTGYAVEIGLLIDLWTKLGGRGLAQVDLTHRHHRSRDLLSLGRAAHQIIEATLSRLEDAGRIKLGDEPATSLMQFATLGSAHVPIVTEDVVEERPPMRSVLERGR